MKLSTKGRYGIRAMYDLALCYGGGPQTVKAISDRQGVPEAYLEQLIAKMRKAGLVQSVRGAQGGYLLERVPAEISIGSILRAAEGSLAPASCVLEDENCEHASSCAMHALWRRIHTGVNDLLDSMTLEDLLHDAEHTGTASCRLG